MATSTALAFASSTLTPQDTHTLTQVWSNLKADSCPHSYNFHLHTHCSDGQLHPEDLIQQAVNLGLKGLAITDHHSVRGYQAAQRWLEEAKIEQPHQQLPHLWTGVEITSTLLNIEVHILGYAFDPNHSALRNYLKGNAPKGNKAKAVNVISAIHQAGGLVVLAHPERYRLPAQKLVPAAVQAGIDGVETYYAYRRTNPWKPTPAQTKQVENLSEQFDLFRTCGTDSHGLNILLRL
ncbi:PHP domain-containing protein [Lusitaniella coriacea LEGE 07157]|uniref:PHP domain-containing protein n=1 Tax=Lusitaniella coriacea LEGE 07157 TaxID=945747 RepID=A0A8J7IU86_9CYAN|nr:PHP domain-containing protein [Lusitaniella coriacea]MBE9117362.1 PHP domain-containing protein [Lusitaniella coriacea LEGE 07157]